jgi:hypothetical protein
MTMVYYVQCLNPGCHAFGVRPLKAVTPGPCHRCGSGMQKIPTVLYETLLHHHPEVPVENRDKYNADFLSKRDRRRAYI